MISSEFPNYYHSSITRSQAQWLLDFGGGWQGSKAWYTPGFTRSAAAGTINCKPTSIALGLLSHAGRHGRRGGNSC